MSPGCAVSTRTSLTLVKFSMIGTRSAISFSMSYEKKGGIFLKTCGVFLTLKMLEILHMEIKGMKVFYAVIISHVSDLRIQ